MTDPEDKPSFLARLSIVATVGVVVSQFVLFVGGVMEKRFINRAYPTKQKEFSDAEVFGKAVINIDDLPDDATTAQPKVFDGHSLLFVCLLIALSYLVVAGLYYLIKGKPTNADAVIASRLYRVWGASVIVGAIYSFLI
jgi:hypothetical protein